MFSKDEIAKRALKLEQHLIDGSQSDDVYDKKSYQRAYIVLKDVLLKAKQGEIKAPITDFPFLRLFDESEGWFREFMSGTLYAQFTISVGVLTQEEHDVRRSKMFERMMKVKAKRDS